MSDENDTRTIWATGRRGCVAAIGITQTPLGVIASAEADHITENQMRRALMAEFADLIFNFTEDGGYRYAGSTLRN